MNLIKTSYYTFISTVIKMLSALVINKAVAYFVGPSGLALIGQFQNFSQLAMTAAQGAINAGVVKYTSEYKKEGKDLRILFSTAFKISIICSVVTGLLLIIFAKTASVHFLNQVSYYSVFVIFGLTIILFSLNGLLLSILNGLQEIKIFVKANVMQSLLSLVLTTVLIIYWGIHGALIALVTNQSLIFFALLFLVRKHELIKISNFNGVFTASEGIKLLRYSIMAIVSATITPISLLIIRNHITNSFGLDAAGQWQAIWYISTIYLLVVTTTLSVYYLPKLSAISEPKELKIEIIAGYKIIMPIVTICALLIFISKDLVIQILFSKEFFKIKELFLFQLIGDVLKLLAWLLSYVMLAKAMTKAFIITEIIFVSSFVFFAYIFTNKFGLVGVTYAYALNYFLYFICMVLIFRKLLFSKHN